MSCFGFIGFGSMAKMLIKGLVEYADVKVSDIIVTRKDKNKFAEISTLFPGIKIGKTIVDVVNNANYIFLCIKPADVKNVLLEIKPYIRSDIHLISLAGTVKLDHIQNIINCRMSKLIPTITSDIGEGINLVCHNAKVTQEDKSFFNFHIGKLGKIKIVADNDIGFAAELTSCGPGFIASIFDNMVKTAALHTHSFTSEEIAEMVTYTLYSTSKLLYDRQLAYSDVIERVATKGGITQEGVAVFNEMLPAIFEVMFSKTLEKRNTVENRIDEDFASAQ